MSTKLAHMKEDPPTPTDAAPAQPEGPHYPYGLTLNLNDAALKKLGLDALPKVDTTCEVTGRAKVTHVSSSADSGLGKTRSVELQITHLAVEPDETEPADAAKTAGKLYDGGNAEKAPA